jgi:two-component system sensor histidine kinase AdeS
LKSDGAAISRLIPQVELLGRIINDLSLISLASAGQFQVQLTAIDLAQAVGAVLDLVEPEFSSRGISIDRDLRSAEVRADPERLHQVVLALLDNVVRHAWTGGKALVTTGILEGSGFVQVSDWGPGLDETSRFRVFEPFWRQEDSRSREHGGSGLGLAVVSSIAKAHGGIVEALHRSGGGLTIRVRLPAETSRLSTT